MVRFFFKIMLCCIISISVILDFLIIFSKFIGSAFRAQLMHQCYNMPDVDMIFTGMTIFYFIYHIYIYLRKIIIFISNLVQVATPDLSVIFEQKKRRFYKRTSSAQWGNAPVTHKY